MTGPCYVGTDREVLKKAAKAKVQPILKYLENKDFAAGDNISYMDFFLLELYDFIEFLTESEFYAENKSAKQYAQRMKSLRQISNYMASSRYLARPFNNKVARINN